MPTRYEPINKVFTDKAHVAAIHAIYPRLFGVEASRLIFDEQTQLDSGARGQVLDGEMAIDYIVRVPSPAVQYPIPFTVQERFRRLGYSRYRDITMTAWNRATNLPSELYKLRANYFMYGYFDDRPNTNIFSEVVVVSVPHLLLGITRGTVKVVEKENKKYQTFITVTFEQLKAINALVLHYPFDGATHERLR